MVQRAPWLSFLGLIRSFAGDRFVGKFILRALLKVGGVRLKFENRFRLEHCSSRLHLERMTSSDCPQISWILDEQHHSEDACLRWQKWPCSVHCKVTAHLEFSMLAQLRRGRRRRVLLNPAIICEGEAWSCRICQATANCLVVSNRHVISHWIEKRRYTRSVH